MERKGQAAMEYLMTYGWAILIVIIVAAALYALGVFNPATWTGSRATGFANIGAPASGAWKLDASAGSNQMVVVLKNNLPSRIQIDPTQVSVRVGSTDCIDPGVKGNQSAAQTVGIGENFNITANCGTQSSGSAFTANVEITYDNLDTGITGLKESGTITGTVS